MIGRYILVTQMLISTFCSLTFIRMAITCFRLRFCIFSQEMLILNRTKKVFNIVRWSNLMLNEFPFQLSLPLTCIHDFLGLTSMNVSDFKAP